MSELHIEILISDLALILVLAAIAIVLFKKLKQPVVLGYIVAGFLASPHFSFLPTVNHESNIEFWGQIGIIVLLFSIGLEFSFKKLLKVGGAAIITTLILVLGMTSIGYLVGRELLHFAAVDSIFLGAMLSMSSTTIIIKALGDLNMMRRKFVPTLLAVLIVEDLVAVVMMVVLSSIAINKTVEGSEMMHSILKLAFFLIIWFVVGILLIPSIFKRIRNILSDEILLIIAMGLCFLMAIFSVKSGFSLALGAFVMGSILAGTSQAERIERVIKPVKDLFGAVFFISVGMMVNPHIIVQYAGTIALLSAVVIVGMIVFGTFGMLVSGQSLRDAMQSGFCLTQIGEFSFIIASLGLSLHVLDKNIYPIVVAVSVVTIFFTPFFIKQATPCYNWVEAHLPKRWNALLEGYKASSEAASTGDDSVWKAIIGRYLGRVVIYSVVVIAIIIASRAYMLPFMKHALTPHWGRLVTVVVSLLVMLPLLSSIVTPSSTRRERERLLKERGRISYVPFSIMTLASIAVCMVLVMSLLYGIYSSVTTVVAAIVTFVLCLLALSPRLRQRSSNFERRFVANANDRNQKLVSDMHLSRMSVGYNCPFVGKTLREADIRRKYGVNVVNISRGGAVYPLPEGDMRVFPMDVLEVIGTEDDIEKMSATVENNDVASSDAGEASENQFVHFALSDKSPIIGKTLSTARLREDYKALLVAVQRNDKFFTPTPDLTFATGDVIWIVGNPEQLAKLE